MSTYIHKSHNVSVLLYHLVFPAKYRRAVIDATVDRVLREVCLEIEARYQLKFLEIGTDEDHVHLLVQSVPTYSVTKLVTIIKSLTARGLPTLPRGEGAAVGWRVLDRRLLREHRRPAREREGDRRLRQAARLSLSEAPRGAPARAVLKDPAPRGGDPLLILIFFPPYPKIMIE